MLAEAGALEALAPGRRRALWEAHAPRLEGLFDGVRIEAAVAGTMIYIVNEDKLGLIGGVGTVLGDAGVNISDFTLGRRAAKGEAIALVSIDGAVPKAVMSALAALPQVKQARLLSFAPAL